MWMTSMALTYSDRVTLQSIKALQGRVLTVKEIAEHASMPYGTCKDSVARLRAAGTISCEGRGRRWGYEYEVKESAHEA